MEHATGARLGLGHCLRYDDSVAKANHSAPSFSCPAWRYAVFPEIPFLRLPWVGGAKMGLFLVLTGTVPNVETRTNGKSSQIFPGVATIHRLRCIARLRTCTVLSPRDRRHLRRSHRPISRRPRRFRRFSPFSLYLRPPACLFVSFAACVRQVARQREWKKKEKIMCWAPKERRLWRTTRGHHASFWTWDRGFSFNGRQKGT
ncbi:uncharacterized protein J3D65DRAFT_633115 [Phyllosticta citribraziliensis]|uniref:Uncharacterized protein n=1 Tax=Phyllosticta citribraziliensis TaxID=989973 RepID=A0ABR1LIH6_9PEZI